MGGLNLGYIPNTLCSDINSLCFFFFHLPKLLYLFTTQECDGLKLLQMCSFKHTSEKELIKLCDCMYSGNGADTAFQHEFYVCIDIYLG